MSPKLETTGQLSQPAESVINSYSAGMAAHEQTWVKVNTQVDRKMARIIAALSTIEGLQTLQSCQCDRNGEAYVYFTYGTAWERVCHLVFAGLLPALEQAGIHATGAVEVFNGSLPTAKIGFSAMALEKATIALESFVSTLSS